MRVGVLYYSGAGNTEVIAERLTQILRAQPGIEITFLERVHTEVEYAALRDRYDVLCAGFPVHFGRAPALAGTALREIAVGGRRIVGFCTYSVLPGAAVTGFGRLARHLGMVSGAWVRIRMPPTHMLLFTPRRSRRAAWLQGWFSSVETELKLARLAGSLRWPSSRPAGGNYPAVKVLATFGLWPLHVWNLQGRAGDLEALPGRCTQCGLCARGCPTGNISLAAGYPQFGDRCSLCLACIHRCPTEAIQMGRHTVETVRYLPVWPRASGLANARS
ncbi:MAG TPA: hypothetical protein EYP62_04375 [Kiritimatiellae bacterium]|nr:hypothetical protein [Kiritimatiellia bacterium]